MNERQFKKLLKETVFEIDTVNDAPFGVLLQRLTGKVWKGTDGNLYIVKEEYNG